MSLSPNDIIYCGNLGNSTSEPNCCLASDQNSNFCRATFITASASIFAESCTLHNDCLIDCQNTTNIYASLIADDPSQGNGRGPFRKFKTCANVPGIAQALWNNRLASNISTEVKKYISVTENQAALKGVTAAVTDCLSATCRNARRPGNCRMACSGVNLLVNSTTPNITGINTCMDTLCSGGYGSLPFADADVVGIGVFASYIMQCVFVVILWFGLVGFQFVNRKKAGQEQESPPPQQEKEDSRPDKPSHQHSEPETAQKEDSPLTGNRTLERTQPKSSTPHADKFTDLIQDFHKSQCYFSATLQIAALCYDIFSTDMLITFMLTPLATNGILPVVFSFIILVRAGRASLDSALLTAACCILASVVYWILYSHIIPTNRRIKQENRKTLAYQQFMYKLSAVEECGEYSALAACPDFGKYTEGDINTASDRLTYLTPIIWSFSIFCFLAVLIVWPRGWLRSHEGQQRQPQRGSATDEQSHVRLPRPSKTMASVLYWVTTACFLAGIGMQLSLLSVFTSLRMMDRAHWSFGQVVAVTIWAPPILGYVYKEVEKPVLKMLGREQ